MEKSTIKLKRKSNKIKVSRSVARRQNRKVNPHEDIVDNDIIFDPTVKFDNELESAMARIVWQSESIDMAMKAVSEGLPLKHSPFFKNNTGLRQANLLYKMSEYEKSEFKRCKYDIIYFAEKYVKLLNEGVENNIILRDYQKRLLVSFQRNKYTICLAGRQIGKTTTTAIFACWMMLFHSQINMALVGDKLATSTENLNKCKDILQALPFFLKPGIEVWNVKSIQFDNRSKCITAPCNKGALVGKAIHVLYIDELAIPKASASKELVSYALPTMQSIPQAKFIASSTPSGENIFKHLWVDAINGANNFVPIQVNWWEVPNRDAKWVKEQIAIFGIDDFNEQFNCTFLSSTNSLYSHETIQQLEQGLVHFRPIEVGEVDNRLFNVMKRLGLRKNKKTVKSTEQEPYKFFTVNSEITDLSLLKNEHIIMQIDIAEGILGDYSVINCFRLRRGGSDPNLVGDEDIPEVKPKPKPKVKSEYSYDDFDGHNEKVPSEFEFMVDDDVMDEAPINEEVYLEQIALFHSNETSIELLALFARTLAHTLFNPDQLRIVPEMNKYGREFVSLLLSERNADIQIEEDSIGKTERNGKQVYGVYMLRGTKNRYVKSSKIKVETGEIDILEKRTLDETKYFGERPNGTYGASVGFHDDIVMTIVGVSAYADPNNEDYAVFIEDMGSHSLYDDDEGMYDEDFGTGILNQFNQNEGTKYQY